MDYCDELKKKLRYLIDNNQVIIYIKMNNGLYQMGGYTEIWKKTIEQYGKCKGSNHINK